MEWVMFIVVYSLVGIGSAIGTMRKEDGDGIAFLKFFLAFFLWPILAGFKLTVDDDDED